MAKSYLWTGALSTGFATPQNWDDLTDGTSRSASVPGSTDTATFGTGDGTVTGSGTTDILYIGGVTPSVWEFIGQFAAASLEVGVNTTGGGGVIIVSGAGSTLDITGTATIGGTGSGGLEIATGAVLSGRRAQRAPCSAPAA
jgi:T5SS/PEP-CTERM-associated repeat protein